MENRKRNGKYFRINSIFSTILVLFLITVTSALAVRKFTKEQMRENTIRINALEKNEVTINLIPPKAPQEVTIVLDSRALNFDFDKSDVKERYYPILQNLKEYIETNNYDVTIIGHTDSKGSNEYNIALGLRRAKSVRAKLIEFGVAPDRIRGAFSKGEEEPIASNSTDEGRFQNRRIEFRLVKRD